MAVLVLVLLALDIIIGSILKKKFYTKDINKESDLNLLPKSFRYLSSFGLLICLYLVAIKNMHYSYVLILLFALNALDYYLRTIKLYKINKSYYYTLFKFISSLILTACVIALLIITKTPMFL